MLKLIGSISAFAAALALAQSPAPQARLTAREIFYAAKPPDPAPAAATKPKVPITPTSPPPKKPRETAQVAQAKPADLPVRLATDTTTNSSGLAMRWAITQLMPDGIKKEVPTTKSFKSGDRINVRVEVNDFGYLYILARGSSGKWSPLFPSPQISGGDNRVGPNQAYTIPAGFVFKFDETPGQENIFVVFSRKPEPDFDSLIYKVSPDRKSSPPSPAEPIRPMPGIMLASNSSIGDPFVDRIRTMYARDLIVEKVDGDVKTSSAGPRFEHASYVASKRQDDPRVVAEVSLVHK